MTDVAPILKERCIHCHTLGGIAPFAMDSHATVRGWSSMIKEVLLTRRMPPMQVDPRLNISPMLAHIKPSEIRVLVKWIDEGALHGKTADDPLKLALPDRTLGSWGN